jgi:hypothetical protein
MKNVEKVILLHSIADVSTKLVNLICPTTKSKIAKKNKSNKIRIGDPCYATSDCRDSNCVNGTCVGAGLGESCGYVGYSYIDCNYGSYCNSSARCAAQSAEGGDCAYADDQCLPFLYCDHTNKCAKPYSIASGGYCDNSQLCQPGLACKMGVCSKEAPAKSCSVNDDCPVFNRLFPTFKLLGT